jgi:hypothetical protein
MDRGVSGQEMLEIERLKLSRCDRAQHRSAQAVQEKPEPRPALRARGRAGALEGFGRRAYVRQSGLALRGPATATPPPAIGPPTRPRGPLANKRMRFADFAAWQSPLGAAK